MRNAKKSLFRRLSALLLVLLLLPLSGLLSACHGAEALPAFEVPDGLDPDRKFELTFWAKNDTNKNQTLVYEKAIRDFEALYPNIRINLRLYTDYGRIYNDVITNIATQTTPNICITYPDHIATYRTGVNVVAPLNALMDDPDYGLRGSKLLFDGPSKDEIVPQYLEECAFDGTYLALPYMRSTEALYVNKTYVEALGYEVPEIMTWDQIFEISEKALEKDADGNFRINGQKVLIPFIYKSTDNMMIQLLRQMGAGYSTPEGETLIFNDDTKAVLYRVADEVGKGTFSTFKISSYPANFLNAGQCIFAVDSTAGATWMGSEAPLSDIPLESYVDFETAVRIVPQVDPSDPQMISQGPSMCIFNKRDPQEVLASWLFMQFLLTNGVEIGYASTEGYVPVTKKAQESPEYREYLGLKGTDADHYGIKIEASELLMANIENTFTTPVYNGSASLRDAAGSMIEQVALGIRRKKTVDESFMEALFDDMTKHYHLAEGSTGPGAEKADLGPLPVASRTLLIVLVSVWAVLGGFALARFIIEKKRKSENGD